MGEQAEKWPWGHLHPLCLHPWLHRRHYMLCAHVSGQLSPHKLCLSSASTNMHYFCSSLSVRLAYSGSINLRKKDRGQWDSKFQGTERKGVTSSNWAIPLACRIHHPMGKGVAREGPEQTSLRVEHRAMSSLAWFKGQDFSELMGGYI